MTINVPLPSLGPSWVPKLGGILGVFGIFGTYMPDTLPGAKILKPWLMFCGAVSVPILGFSTRQVNKTSEQQGLAPQPNPNAVPAPNPPTK